MPTDPTPGPVEVALDNARKRPECWTCKKNLHPDGVHPEWYCQPQRCPDRAKHAENVYGKRFGTRYGGMSRDGVTVVRTIDGEDASKNYRQERCICGLLLIWKPKEHRND